MKTRIGRCFARWRSYPGLLTILAVALLLPAGCRLPARHPVLDAAEASRRREDPYPEADRKPARFRLRLETYASTILPLELELADYGDERWAVLREYHYLLDVPDRVTARHDSLPLSPNDYRAILEQIDTAALWRLRTDTAAWQPRTGADYELYSYVRVIAEAGTDRRHEAWIDIDHTSRAGQPALYALTDPLFAFLNRSYPGQEEHIEQAQRQLDYSPWIHVRPGTPTVLHFYGNYLPGEDDKPLERQLEAALRPYPPSAPLIVDLSHRLFLDAGHGPLNRFFRSHPKALLVRGSPKRVQFDLKPLRLPASRIGNDLDSAIAAFR